MIGRITTAGVVTEYSGPTRSPYGITAGPDGALWFNEANSVPPIVPKLGRITTSGIIDVFPLPTASLHSYGITVGPDGALWFTNPNGNKIGRAVLPDPRNSTSRVGIFRQGFYWLLDVDGSQQFNPSPDQAFAFGGIPGDIPITGDWTGDGRTKAGIYRPANGLFILDTNGNRQFDADDYTYDLGVGAEAGDVPVAGDWNGDGRTKIGLFRQGFFWILDHNGDGVFQQDFDRTHAFGGVAGDVPVVGDWNGSGTSKIGLFRQGFFWILDTNGTGVLESVNQPGGDEAFAFGGIAGDVPIVGDWNADRRSKVRVFRSTFSGC